MAKYETKRVKCKVCNKSNLYTTLDVIFDSTENTGIKEDDWCRLSGAWYCCKQCVYDDREDLREFLDRNKDGNLPVKIAIPGKIINKNEN